MDRRFSYFVVLAGMRTGSNLLEERLNMMSGVTSYGEVFNPAFAGHAHKKNLFGMSPDEIAQAPEKTIKTICAKTEGIGGFRLFRGHNAAALGLCLDDPDCAKIILRRNPIDSFVSLKIVEQTNQWRVQDVRQAKSAKVEFDGNAFRQYLSDTAEFYDHIARRLKETGQTAFQIDYDDLHDTGIISGLGKFLGKDDVSTSRGVSTKKQNPEPLDTKVTNFDEMVQEVASLDPLGMLNNPTFEPTRGPNVKSYVVQDEASLCFAPIAGTDADVVLNWMSSLSKGAKNETDLNQSQLRTWKRKHPGHRAFTVISHPVERAWAAYCTHMVTEGADTFLSIRDTLEKQHDLRLPLAASIADIDLRELSDGFLGFLKFLKLNLNGQTMVRVDPSWASQTAVIQGLTTFAPLHDILFQSTIVRDLEALAVKQGVTDGTTPQPAVRCETLASIYDKRIENAARAAYQRDYINLGFSDWGASA